jgi:hypothetical protein
VKRTTWRRFAALSCEELAALIAASTGAHLCALRAAADVLFLVALLLLAVSLGCELAILAMMSRSVADFVPVTE